MILVPCCLSALEQARNTTGGRGKGGGEREGWGGGGGEKGRRGVAGGGVVGGTRDWGLVTVFARVSFLGGIQFRVQFT